VRFPPEHICLYHDSRIVASTEPVEAAP